MRTLAQKHFVESEFGEDTELPHAGSTLENPYVFHDTALELKAMAKEGRVEIVEEQRATLGQESLISALTFRRLRR